jgi:hypothetical protein
MSSGIGLTLHLAGLFVGSHSDELGMAKESISRPLHKRHFYDDLRPHLTQRGHVFGGDAFTPMAGFAAWQVREGLIAERCRPLSAVWELPSGRGEHRTKLGQTHSAAHLKFSINIRSALSLTCLV